jgi:CHAD domain-containing protein
MVCSYTAYISSPQQSDEDKKERVLCALVVQEEDAVERLVECLAGDSAHSTHRYMARKLREALEKKRQHPECELYIIFKILQCTLVKNRAEMRIAIMLVTLYVWLVMNHIKSSLSCIHM